MVTLTSPATPSPIPTLPDCLVAPNQHTFLGDLVSCMRVIHSYCHSSIMTLFTSTVLACGQARRSGLSQRAGAAQPHSHPHSHSSSASSVPPPLFARPLPTLLTSQPLLHRVAHWLCGRPLHSPSSASSQLPHPSSLCRIRLSPLCWSPQLRSPSSVSVKNAALSHRPLARSVHTNIVGLVGVVHSFDSVDFAVHRLQVVGQAICAGAAHLPVVEWNDQR